MSRARTVAVGLALWCAVVALVASLVWVVVGRAGAGVLPSAEPSADATGSLPVPHSHSAGDVRPGVVLTPRSSSSAPTAPSTSPKTGPPSTRSTHEPNPSSPLPAPAAQRRSWSGTAGHVVAQCRGAAASLVSAYPNTGWGYDLLSRGPAEVRVRFQRDGEDHGITVTARCVGGVPQFSVSGHESGED